MNFEQLARVAELSVDGECLLQRFEGGARLALRLAYAAQRAQCVRPLGRIGS